MKRKFDKNLHASIDLRERDLEEREEALQKKVEEYNKLKTRISTIVLNNNEKIKLNIGGTIFETTLQTITSDKESFFTGMFSEEFGHKCDEKGEYFIDRNPLQFSTILDHLRGVDVTNRITRLSRDEFEQLEAEIDFYNIQSMFEHFPRLYNINQETPNSNFNAIITSKDGALDIWDTSTGQQLRAIRGPFSYIRHITQLKDGIHIACTGDDGNIRVWNITTGACVLTAKTQGGCMANTTVVELDDGKLATGGGLAVEIFDITSNQRVRSLNGHTSPVTEIVALKNGGIASGGYDDTIRIWHINSGACLHELPHTKDPNTTGSRTTSIIVIDDDRIVSSRDTIKVWNIASGVCLNTMLEPKVLRIFNWGNGCFLTHTMDGNIKIWNAQYGKPLKMIPGAYGSVFKLSDARIARAYQHQTPQCVEIYETTSEVPQRVVSIIIGDSCFRLVELANGAIVTSATGKIQVWDIAGSCLQSFGPSTGVASMVGLNIDIEAVKSNEPIPPERGPFAGLFGFSFE
jgi:WD40 repeat protein